MFGEVKDPAAVREARDRLRNELANLDRLGEKFAAIELNSAIEILNDRLGESTDPDQITRMMRRQTDN